MTKACWGSALLRLGKDWGSGGEEDKGSSESGEAKRWGGEALRGPICGSDWRKSFTLIEGSPESLWVPSSRWFPDDGATS